MCASRFLFLHDRCRLFSRLGALVCLMGIQVAQAGDDLPKAVQAVGPAFVQASLARVRAAPNREAGTLAWLVTNTPVKLIALREAWCEIESGAIPNSGTAGETAHGFVACDLLAAEPLTLARVNAQLAKNDLSAKSRLNWLSRAFWIAPSLTRWATVGGALENAYLDEATRRQEIVNTTPQRFKVQEFEAMKQHLANGVSVTPEAYLASPAWTSEFYQDVPLPQIKPSYFKKGEILVISSRHNLISLVDALSAFNGASFRAVVTAPAFYALHPEIPAVADTETWSNGAFFKVASPVDVIMGIWDVSGLLVTFDGDATLHGVTAHGEPTARNVREIRLHVTDSRHLRGYYCDGADTDTSGVMESKPVAGYAPSTSAILRWAGKPIPGGASARATIRTQRLTSKKLSDPVVAHEIDVDRDGVMDFLIWRGNNKQQEEEYATETWEVVFANIGGTWQLLHEMVIEDCPC